MIDVIEKTYDLIDEFNNTDFVKKMRKTRKEIIDNNLINTDDVRTLYNNPTIHEYVENQNILDMHIYYLNSRINELINKGCKNESN